MNPDLLRYSSSHEWLSDGDPMTLGISDFAQEQLGDVVYVELPQAGPEEGKQGCSGRGSPGHP